MIEGYSFGRIEIDGKKYTEDLIIFPDHIYNSWWREEGHRLRPEDLEEVVETEPELLIVGTGANGRMKVPQETRKYIESKGIELITESTGEATKTYNEISDSKKTVAALHLTC